METSSQLHTTGSYSRAISHVRLSDGYLLRREDRAAVSPCVTAKRAGTFIDVVVVPFVFSSARFLGFSRSSLSFVSLWEYDHTAITLLVPTCIEHCQ
jgi:hypothetical protein